MATKKPLDPSLWAEIQRHWEYDPDQPSYAVAATRAAEKFQFSPPSKSTIDSRAKRENWERRGSMTGINQSAMRKADAMVNSDGTPVSDAPSDGRSDASDAKKAQASRAESEDKRAEVTARHRQEWAQVAVLRQEALQRRNADSGESFHRLKIAKITAEITTLQQNGERKAWGMELTIDPAHIAEMSDAQLEAISAGRMPK